MRKFQTCRPKPENASLNLPNWGAHFVTRNPTNEQKTNLWDVRPVEQNPEMEAQNLPTRGVQLVARKLEVEALLIDFTQHPQVLMVGELVD